VFKQDTIVACATPEGRSGVAVIRISGHLVQNIATSILGKVPQPRVAMYTNFYDAQQTILDTGLALFFPQPHSFTGEDILELQGHGSYILIQDIIQTIINLGARLARPGEFSERAFLNNKIDLIQAEAIADVIDANSQVAARAALRSLQGEFSQKIYSLLEKLIALRMYVEAAIDFVEEEINFLADQTIESQLKNLIAQVEHILKNATQGSLLREGIQVVIIGEPNVGKSSLLNALSGRNAAIVTDIAGTTRDVLREKILIDGLPLHIIDTAGLRHSSDIVEQEGIRRAKQEIAQADLLLMMVDAKDKTSKIAFKLDLPYKVPHIIIRNKIDLLTEVANVKYNDNHTCISLSVKTGEGLSLLKSLIKKTVGFQEQSEGIFSARHRHLTALNHTVQHLKNGLHQLKQYQAGELLAEELRLAQQCLNEITGEFTSDDLLGKIFSSFCIGK